LLLSAYYRKQLNFTWDSLGHAEGALRRLTACLARLDAVTREGAHPAIASEVDRAKKAFAEAMMQDLNTAAALGAMFDLVAVLNSAVDAGDIGTGDLPMVREAFDGFDRILGVLELRRAEEKHPPVPVEEIERLIEERHAARRRREFAAADRIRNELAGRGVILEDSPAGTRWKRK
jgi:cysteinyl-tRNA synthetase